MKMKTALLSAIMMFLAFSLSAQDERQSQDADLQKLTEQITEVSNSDLSDEEKQERIADLIRQFTDQASNDETTTTVTKEQVEEYLDLLQQADAVLNPDLADASQPRTRGAGPTPERWSHYWNWYKGEAYRVNIIPGYCLVLPSFREEYERETRCNMANECLDVQLWAYSAEAVGSIR